MTAPIRFDDDVNGVALPLICLRCGHPTAGLGLIRRNPDGSAYMTVRHEQIQIRDNHCKES